VVSDKELLQKALELLNQTKLLTIEIQKIAAILGERHGPNARFIFNGKIITAKHHPNAQTEFRKWDLCVDETLIDLSEKLNV